MMHSVPMYFFCTVLGKECQHGSPLVVPQATSMNPALSLLFSLGLLTLSLHHF